MAKLTVVGQRENPITIRIAQNISLAGVANEVVPLGSSLGWENFADTNWVSVLTAYGTVSASRATVDQNRVQVVLHATTCLQISTTNAIAVNIIGIGRPAATV